MIVVDIGGATTDVYSCLTPEGEDAGLRKDVVAPLWHARTVEGDLGMRWNAEHVVEAAVAEHLLDTVADPDALTAYAARVHERPARSRSTTPSAPSTSSWRGWRRSSRCVGTRARPSRRSRRARSPTSRPSSGPGECCATPTRPGATTCSARSRRPRRWVEGAARGARDGRHGIPALRRRPAGRRPPRRRPPRRHPDPPPLTVERPRLAPSHPSSGHVSRPPTRRVATFSDAHPHPLRPKPLVCTRPARPLATSGHTADRPFMDAAPCLST